MATYTTTDDIIDILNNYNYLVEETSGKVLVEPSTNEMYFCLERELHDDNKLEVLVQVKPTSKLSGVNPFACSFNHKIRLLKKGEKIDIPISFCKFFSNIVDSPPKEYPEEFIEIVNNILDGGDMSALENMETEGGCEETHKLHMLTSVVYGNTSEGSGALNLGKLASYALDSDLDNFKLHFLSEEEFNEHNG